MKREPRSVFISYAREDARFALRLNKDLRDLGFKTWIDKEQLVAGSDWETEIKRAIEKSSHFILLISEFSVGKRGFIQKEIAIALDALDLVPPENVFLIPVRLDTSEPGHERLRHLQWIEMFESYEAALSEILMCISPRKLRNRKITEFTFQKVAPLSRDNVRLSGIAMAAAKGLGYDPASIVDFLLTEYQRHRLAYLSSFSSVPLIFQKHMLLISWDRAILDVEALLDRADAFPGLPVWLSLLRSYREGMALSYRKRPPGTVFFRSEVRRALKVATAIVQTATSLLGSRTSDSINTSALSILLQDAEGFAFAEDETENGAAVARVEMILSSAHKLLLQHLPYHAMELEPFRPVEPTPFEAGGKKKILIVDDEPALLVSVGKYLSRVGGYSVSLAKSGEAALAALVEMTPDLVLTDLTMPGLDGFAVSEAAEQLPTSPPVLMFSGYPCDISVVETVDAFLQKPALPTQLTALIARLLRDDKECGG